MLIKTFEDIEAWKKLRELTEVIYQVSMNDEFACDFNLRNQIQRASVSIMSNISKALNEAEPGNES